MIDHERIHLRVLAQINFDAYNESRGVYSVLCNEYDQLKQRNVNLVQVNIDLEQTNFKLEQSIISLKQEHVRLTQERDVYLKAMLPTQPEERLH